MKRLLLGFILLFAAAGVALAQFPPPGAYACTDVSGAALGTLFLAPDGDYTFTAPDGTKSEGQISSSGTDVQAISGVLFDDYHLAGSFLTEAGVTTFTLSSDKGAIGCGPAA